MTGFVGDPLLVHFLIDSREDTEKISTTSVGIDVGAHGIHSINRVVRFELPRAGLERVRQVVECTNRAKIDHIARELVGNNLLNIGGDFVLFATHDLTESVLSSDELSKSNAAGAVNAASHGSLDEGAKLLVFNGALVFHKATFSVAVDG